MPLSEEQIAKAVLKETKKRGKELARFIRSEIVSWLNQTNWFTNRFPTVTDRVTLVSRVERIIRQKWSLKGQETKRRKRKSAVREMRRDLFDE